MDVLKAVTGITNNYMEELVDVIGITYIYGRTHRRHKYYHHMDVLKDVISITNNYMEELIDDIGITTKWTSSWTS